MKKITTLCFATAMIVGGSAFVLQNYQITFVPLEAIASEENCIDDYDSEKNCTDDYDYECDY